MQSLTFIIFIVSEKIATFKFLPHIDTWPAGWQAVHPSVWPNTDHYSVCVCLSFYCFLMEVVLQKAAVQSLYHLKKKKQFAMLKTMINLNKTMT